MIISIELKCDYILCYIKHIIVFYCDKNEVKNLIKSDFKEGDEIDNERGIALTL